MSVYHLILGGGGFIGRHVAIKLARAGHRVRIASRRAETADFPEDVRGVIEAQNVDLIRVDWDALIAEAAVIHDCAWGTTPSSAEANPAGELDKNIRPLLGLLEALKRKGAGRLIFASSGGSVYGCKDRRSSSEEMPLSPVSAYGAAKAAAEAFLGYYRARHGIDVRIARIANVYGAGQDLTMGVGAVSSFIDKAQRPEPIVIWGDGDTTRDYIHVSDVARCLVCLAEAEATGADYVFNVSTGQGTSLNQLVSLIEAVLHRKLEVRYERGRPFDVTYSVLSTERTERALGWTHSLPLTAGIARTIADLRAGMGYSTLD